MQRELKRSEGRLALVARDASLAGQILAHLGKGPDVRPLTCSYEEIRARLGPLTDGLLLLAVDGAADSEDAVRLIQEISLHKWPPIVLLVEGPKAAPARDLEFLEEFVTQRFRWPEDAASLARMVSGYVGEGPGFTAPADESLAATINRRLLAQVPSLQVMAEGITLAACYDVPVLLTGETGTGKTYLARLMHDCSPHCKGRFQVVSCGALSPNLIESEFFGHAKGAFTGADQAKEGKFAAAGDGTLLLDEIDALTLEQQANLLRVLETGEYEPVGSNETRHCRARIIAASNWDLEEAIAAGKFRRDLYFRLHVMAFHLPPLRERTQDIAPLARAVAAHYNAKFHKSLFDISAEALTALELFNWPGNIRQLENVVQQAVLVSAGPILQASHLPPAVRTYATQMLAQASTPPRSESLASTRAELERTTIQRALVNNGNSKTHAANALGISRVTLYKKMKKYGLMKERVPSAEV